VNSVITKAIITEKSMKDAALGKFTFLVAHASDKDSIKRAIEDKFSVSVTKIATTVIKGKRKRVGVRRTEKNVAKMKKAIVTLKKGEKIGLFELGGESA
jgi:large subunit ribosomal protein L23